MIEHVRAQNWTAVGLDFVIVVVGVFIGIQVANWNDEQAGRHRLEQIVEAMRTDMADARRVEGNFLTSIASGVSEFEAALERGEQPTPYVFRIKGSDTAPNKMWDRLRDAGVGELVDPKLWFELSHFYSEREGIGVKITRYMTYTEEQVLPYLHLGPDYFYSGDGAELRPEVIASMGRLKEIFEYLDALGPWSECLEERLDAASEPGPSCRGDYFFVDFVERSSAAGEQY